jgi:hypothetical protein
MRELYAGAPRASASEPAQQPSDKGAATNDKAEKLETPTAMFQVAMSVLSVLPRVCFIADILGCVIQACLGRRRQPPCTLYPRRRKREFLICALPGITAGSGPARNPHAPQAVRSMFRILPPAPQ